MAESDIAPWAGSFTVENNLEDGSGSLGQINLSQIGTSTFLLKSTVTYIGASTGLEDKGLSEEVLTNIRSVGPEDLLPNTDLASVPAPLRWFLNSYGLHTPAALIHDRLIPTDPEATPGMTDAFTDRYFRFMLEDLGVPWLRRWLMWAAVAFRTFYETRRLAALIWSGLALVAIGAFVWSVLAGNIWMAALVLVAAIPSAALWRAQFGAGILAAVCAPFILPPALLAVAGYGTYWVLERLAGVIYPSRSRRPARSYSLGSADDSGPA